MFISNSGNMSNANSSYGAGESCSRIVEETRQIVGKTRLLVLGE